MAQKAITIYTASTEAAHIYAEDEAQHNRAWLGNGGSGIEDVDNLLACAKVDNNTVRLASGRYAMQGYELCVENGTTEDLSVDSGTAGQYRRDYVVAHFTRGGGAVSDTLAFEVLKGTPAASLAAAAYPALPQEDDLSNGGTERYEAVYGLVIAETALSAPVQIAPYAGNFYA